jgi:hypothetical protein
VFEQNFELESGVIATKASTVYEMVSYLGETKDAFDPQHGVPVPGVLQASYVLTRLDEYAYVIITGVKVHLC